MKSLIPMLMACTLGACASVDAVTASSTVQAQCHPLEATTGTNHLSRQSCRTVDAAELDAAREAADTLQRNQVQRSVVRPGQPGGM
jgi:hypothetical protein